MNASIQALITPTAIPADGVELLRHLTSAAGTREAELEAWIRTYPQVIGSSPDLVYPHTRIRLPSEPGVGWEPDILYRETGSSYYDLVELKRADVPIVAGNPLASRWVPSSPPRPTSYLASAISQMQLYLFYAEEFRAYLEASAQLQLLFPRGLVIAGKEIDIGTSQALRLLRNSLPGNIQLLTWTAVLRRAEAQVAHKVLISFPCVTAGSHTSSLFDCGISGEVARQFHIWTGFRSPFLDPLASWGPLLAQARQEVQEYVDTHDIHDNDEEWNACSSFKGRVMGTLYYRLGKYCVHLDQFVALRDLLPSVDHFVKRNAFTTLGERIEHGFQDTQKFLQMGREASSTAVLEASIEALLAERKTPGKVPLHVVEPDMYYRRIMTTGFLQTHVFESSLQDLLSVGGWIPERTSNNR